MKAVQSLKRLSVDRLDVYAAIVGLVASAALLSLRLVTSEILVLIVPGSVGLGCLLYLLSNRTGSRRWTPSSLSEPSSYLSSLSVSRIVPRLVVVGLAGLVIIAVATDGRPLSFLVLAGVTGSLVAWQIVFADLEELDHRIVLAEIVAYAIVVRYAALLTTPGYIGIDIWTHVTSFAAAIRESGSLSALSGIKYYMAPFYHLSTAAAAETLAVPLRTALYLSIGIVVPFSVLSVYAITRYVTGVRWALLATMLFAVSEYVVRWGLYVSTTSLGLVFFLVVLLFLTRISYVNVGRIDYVLLGGFGVAVALTHQLSAFITLVLLGVALTVVYAARFVDTVRFPNDSRYLATAVGTFFAFTAVQWALTPWNGELLITGAIELIYLWLTDFAGFLNLVSDVPVRGAEESGIAAGLATAVDNAGFFLFLVIGTLGSLAMLRRTHSVGTYTFIGAISAMMVFTFGLPLFGFRLLPPERWYAFIYAPMAVVGAVGLEYYANHFSARDVAVGLLLVLFLFPTTMVMAHPATIDDPTFDRQWTKFAYTEPEVAAGETFRETVPREVEPIYTDHPYFKMVTRIDEHPSERAVADYSFSAYIFTMTGSGHAEPDNEYVVYRAHQSEGHTLYFEPSGPAQTDREGTRVGRSGGLVTGQVSAEQVCPETRNYVYTNPDVRMCVDP